MLLRVSLSWTVYSIFAQAASVASAGLSVEVGKAVGVGVGWGMSKVCPSNNVSHAAGNSLRRTILWMDTPKLKAIVEQVSPNFTTYENGVGDGTGVLVTVGVTGVGEAVLVAVIVTVAVFVEATAWTVGWRIAKYTSDAPIAINNANSPSAMGRLRVITGMRLP